MNTLSPSKVGTALAIAAAIAYIICVTIVLLLPASVTEKISRNIFHGLVTQTPNITIEGSLLGIIVLSIWSWIVGAVFAVIYNNIMKESGR